MPHPGSLPDSWLVRYRRYVLLAYLVSGGCSLVYQLVWYHLFVDQLGASGTTYLVVLCSFIGGLGAGAISSDRVLGVLARWTRVDGLRLYGLVELLISLSVWLLIVGLRLPLVQFIGHEPYHEVVSGDIPLRVPDYLYQLIKIGMAVVAVGIPCFLMGLTYPYLCSIFSRDARFPSHLYAFNTLGACAGIAVAEFVGFRWFGYGPVLTIAIIVNVFLAGWFLFTRKLPAGTMAGETRETPSRGACLSDYPAVLSGFLCGGLEALAFVFIKLTYFSAKGIFALLSFHAIAGIWIASSLVHRLQPKARGLIICAWLALAWCVLLWYVEPNWSYSLVMWGEGHLLSLPLYLKGVIISFAVTGLYLTIPFTCLAMLLPALCDAKQGRGEHLARTYGLNTVSFLSGVLLFGWVFQYVNPFYAARVFLLTALAGLLLLTLIPWGRRLTIGPLVLALVVVTVGLPLVPHPLAMRLIGGLGGQVTAPEVYTSTPQHLFWIKKGTDGAPESLMFDRHSMSAVDFGAQRYMRLMAHVPLLLTQDPQRALLICFGVGSTADAIRMHQSVKAVDVVDLNESVFRLNHAFAAHNHEVLADPSLRLYVDDGRQFIKLTTNRYDLITMEPPPPLNPGISRLYSREFYSDLSRILTDGGMVTQWLPELNLSAQAVELIMSTFANSFPHAFSFVGAGRNVILVGSNRPFDLNTFERRLGQEPQVRQDLARFGIAKRGDFLVSLLHDPSTFAKRWKDGPVIADGRASLDTLLISPVQFFGPREEFRRYKKRLQMEHGALREWIRAQNPQWFGDYLSAYSVITNQTARRLVMPDCYTQDGD